MMLSICTLPMSPAKNSSSVTAALISLRAGRRSNSLDNLRTMGWETNCICALSQQHLWCYHKICLAGNTETVLVSMSWHNMAVRERLLTCRSLLGRSGLRSPAAPCRPSPETALSVGYYLCLGDLVQNNMHTVRRVSVHIQLSVKL